MSAASIPLSVFQSTLSVRRATLVPGNLVRVELDISIHALRKESDVQGLAGQVVVLDFNPRSP